MKFGKFFIKIIKRNWYFDDGICKDNFILFSIQNFAISFTIKARFFHILFWELNKSVNDDIKVC